VTTAQNPTFSSYQAAGDFCLFPRLKSALKGRQRFCVVTDMIKNATEELKRLSQNGFQECFPTNLQSLAEVHSYMEGLLWRKRSLNISTVLYFSEIE
jgi:hypothetical protein